jgi:hypothetical protein
MLRKHRSMAACKNEYEWQRRHEAEFGGSRFFFITRRRSLADHDSQA